MTLQKHWGKRLVPQRLPVCPSLRFLNHTSRHEAFMDLCICSYRQLLFLKAFGCLRASSPASSYHPSCRCCNLIRARVDCSLVQIVLMQQSVTQRFMTRVCQPLALTPRVGVRLNFLTRWYCVTHPPQPKKGQRSREKQFARARNATSI